MPPIPDDYFIERLRSGVNRTNDLIARLTEYHGGPVLTEYGHATRHYAIIIKSTRPVPARPNTLEDMKARTRQRCGRT